MQYARAALKLAETLQFGAGIADSYRTIGNVHAIGVKYNEALENYFKALKIYNDSRSIKGRASTYQGIGRIYAEQGKYAEARSYYLSALKLRQELGDRKNIAYAYSDMGDLLEREENYPEALTYDYKSLRQFEEIDDSIGIASAIYGIGWIEYKQGNYVEAKKKYAAALKTFQALGDKFMVAIMYRNMGEIFFLEGDYKAALENDQFALKTFEEFKLKLPMAWAYTGIGNIYERQGILTDSSGNGALAKSQYLQALHYYSMALETWKEANDKGNTSEAYINISNVHGYLKNITEAKKSLQLSYPIALQIQSKAVFKKYYQSISRLDSIEGNYKQAYEHYKKYIDYRDSLVNEETTKRLSQTKMQYEFDKKEAAAKTIQATKDAEVKRVRNLQYFAIGLSLLIAIFLFITTRQKQKAKSKIEKAYSELQSTQSQLIQSEKMASLGELTAGIAHEIQNPLNFVNNFSEVNKEMLEELRAERLKPKAERDEQTEDEIINDVIDNEEKINHHGRRADAIVKNMLQHSRQTKGTKEPTDINALCDEYLRLSYHGLRAKDKTFNADFKIDPDETIGKINVVRQDIGRVLLNLCNNAFYAVNERQKAEGERYEPSVWVSTKQENDKVIIAVRDNGDGIPQKIVEKIFQPFFTTKPTGQGTGLGLSLSYDIIKAQSGEIKVETKEGEGAEFIITLPLK